MTVNGPADIAVVAIGRNEGERLKACLRSAFRQAATVVYVDSGSSDGSPGYARAAGCQVVELDASLPFSAARARNAGFAWLQEHRPDAALIQFIDGDCELADGWLEQGAAALAQHAEVAIVLGHVREFHPDSTVYNKMCDLEWQQTPGELLSSGGRFMIRAEVFRAAGGFRPEVVAGEEPEFCLRLRRLGWRILLLDVEMARHEAGIFSFAQWWQRTRRSGHAYAQVAALHGGSDEHLYIRDCFRIRFWGLLLPLAALLLAPWSRGLSLLVLLGLYLLLGFRVYRYGRRRGWQPREARIYAWFTVLSKFPALQGMLDYYWRRLRKRPFTIIEYKKDSCCAGAPGA